MNGDYFRKRPSSQSTFSQNIRNTGPGKRTDGPNHLNLVSCFWPDKTIIAATTSCFLLLGIIGALFLPRIYRVQACIRPPAKADLQWLNDAELRLQSTRKFLFPHGSGYVNRLSMPQDVMQAHIADLKSRKLRRQIFDRYVLGSEMCKKELSLNETDECFRKFNDSFQVTVNRDYPGANDAPIEEVTISLQVEEPELGATVLAAFVKLARETTEGRLKRDVDSEIGTFSRMLESIISSAREKAALQRQDKITRFLEHDEIKRKELADRMATLQEKAEQDRLASVERLEAQAEIARHATVEQGPSSIALEVLALNHLVNGAAKQEEGTFGFPVYILDLDTIVAAKEELETRENNDPFISQLTALKRELALLKNNRTVEALRNRQSDDPFIDNLRELEEQVSLLKEDTLGQSDILAAKLVQAPAVPVRPAVPVAWISLIMGALLGLGAGVLLSLFRHALPTIS